MGSVKWLAEPEEHDFPAAADYLALLADKPAARRQSARRRGSGEIKRGQPLSPILLV